MNFKKATRNSNVEIKKIRRNGVILFFSILFASVSAYNLYFYILCSKVISKNKSIHYEIVETKINKGGRGTYHQMKVIYLEKQY